MLRILRKARLQVLENRNFTRYALYALGEVILIVIGILIALWLSDMSEDYKKQEREQFYLAGLREEFEQSRSKLQVLIKINRETYVRARSIAEAIAQPDSVLSEAKISALLFQAFSDDFAYNPNTSVLEELLNAGRLEILSNAELRNKLASWNSRIERIRQQEASLREQRYKVLDIARSGTGSIRRIFEENGLAEGLLGMTPSPDPGSNLLLLESRPFENNVLIFMLTAVYTEQLHYQPLLEEIQKILALIEHDLE